MLPGCSCGSSRSYSPVPTESMSTDPRPDLELLAIDRRSHRPLQLALTPDGLAVIKQRTRSGFHSLKLSSSSSTSHRLIPYRFILAARTHPDVSAAEPTATLSLAALVPSKQRDPDSPLRLWHLDVTVHDADGHARDHTASEGPAALSAVQTWCAELERRAYAGVPRTRRLHCIVNPAGGKGKAKAIWLNAVKPVLDAAGCFYQVSYTGPPSSSTNARNLGLTHDPSAWDALVALSGDGIVHELINGLAAHPLGGASALRQTPIVPIPCGSGNALATSIYGPTRATDVRYAALCALKGNPLPLDLSSFTQEGQPRLYTFLTQAFGLMADLDLGTEHLRWMGDLRFTLGYIQGALSRRRYPCRLDVRGVLADKEKIVRAHNESIASGAQVATTRRELDGKAPEDDEDGGKGVEMPPLMQDGGLNKSLPEGRLQLRRLPKSGNVDLNDGEGARPDEWITLDLEKDGVFFAYGGKVPYVSRDVMLFPAAEPNDGQIDLVLVAPMSRLAALTAMDSAATGGLLSLPSVTYLKCSAYRLSFPAPAPGAREGFLSVDGEKVPYQAFEVQCHKGLARVMCFDGVWGGRTRIDGFA